MKVLLLTATEFVSQQKARNSKANVDNLIINIFTVPPKSAIQNCPSHVTEGHNVTLYCNATGNPPPEVAWIRSGDVLVKDSVHVISAINRSLSGIFQCMAWNGIGNNYTANCTVDVHCK